MKTNQNTMWLPDLSKEVIENIAGFKLDSYLIALEGWRRGLKLKWYKDETELCNLNKYNGSNTQGNLFSLSSKRRTHYFFRSRGDKVAVETVGICKNKEKTKQLLNKKRVPVPEGRTFNKKEEKRMISYAKK